MGAPKPIDFSIAEGRIGAVQRVGPRADLPRKDPVAPVDYSNSLKVTVVGLVDGKRVFPIAPEAKLAELHEVVAKCHDAAAFHRIIAGGKILSNLLMPTEKLHDDANTNASLESFGLGKGDKVQIVVTLQDEADTLKAQAVQEGSNFNGYLSFEDELARERRRATGGQVFSRRAKGSLEDFRYGFQNIEPLHVDPNTKTPYTQPPAAEACKLLERLASDPGIVAVNTRLATES